MAVELIGGAVVGAAVSELLKVVLQAKDRVTNFKSCFKQLESTLETVMVKVQQIQKADEERGSDSKRPEVEALVSKLTDGRILVKRCLKVQYWNWYLRNKYSLEILELDTYLVKIFQVHVAAAIWSDVGQILADIQHMKHNLALMREANGNLEWNQKLDRYDERRLSSGGLIGVTEELDHKIYQFGKDVSSNRSGKSTWANYNVVDLLKVDADAGLLGEGNFGAVYKASMGTTNSVVIKRLKPVDVDIIVFEEHMEFIGSIRHENVADLRAYYCSKAEKLLVYDYYNEGSLSEMLHEPKTVKATGYQSPDMTSPKEFCQQSDIYSFGVVLLELITGKSPALDKWDDDTQAVDLVQWVHTLFPDSVSRYHRPKISDVVILLEEIQRVTVVDVYQVSYKQFDGFEERRPTTGHLIGLTKETKQRVDQYERQFKDDISEAKYCAPKGSGKTTLANYNIIDLLRVDADAGLLGEGNFGTVYKVSAGSTNGVVIKRLKRVDIGIREFEKHMEFVGSIRHQNVADLRAYYYSEGGKFLVYDYYTEGSVAKMMQGKPGAEPISGSPKCHLAWETRLRIAIGAAKGIAFLHTLNSRTFSHGNIRSSNIFINTKNYGCISDIGLIPLINLQSQIVLKEAGYQAPEITDPEYNNQLSDIYSYGVLLLELITGKSPALNKWGDDAEAVDLVQWVIYEIRSKCACIYVMDYDSRSSEPSQINSMKGVLQIAMNCVLATPSERTDLNYVVKLLQDILIDYMKQKSEHKSESEFVSESGGLAIRVTEEPKQIEKGVSSRNLSTCRLGDLGEPDISGSSCEFLPLLPLGCILFPDTTVEVAVELVKPKMYLPFKDDTSNAEYQAPNGCGKTTLENYNIEDLLRVNSDLIGEGNFGEVYNAFGGTTNSVVIKRLKRVDIEISEFEKHMEFIGSIRHENIVDLRAYYYSEAEKFLMYDYYADGKQGAKPIWGSPKCHLAWESRLRIAIGAAKGIAFLHTLNSGTFSHGNIRSSNIFLNTQNYGCISDIGLIALINLNCQSVLKETGYQAPEITDPKNSNQLSDIYSYGVFLLELITGKSPALDKWGDDDEAGDLVQWVIYAIRSSGTSISVMDTDSRASEPSQVNSLKAVLKIALNCVLETPDQRPTLIYVVKLLKGILIDYMKQKADNIWEFSYQKRGPVIGVSEESKQITKGVSGNNSNTFRLGDLGRRQKSEFSCDQFPPLLSTHSIVFPDTTTKVSVELEIPKINLPFQDDTSVADYRAPNGCGKTTLANYTISDLLSVDADAGLIGEGNFGSVSKVLVGTTSSAAVKRLKPVDMGIREFEKHMEFVGSIRHENVVDLRAYYYSDTEKFLVYDYYAEGSVAKMMQGKPGAKPIWGSPKCHLAWDTRLRIAIGAAKGIAHLHTLNNGTFSHGNIRSSNIFVNTRNYGCIADVGLITLINLRPQTVLKAAGY
ncbi:hypothetical protein C5167_015255 [Papaver somniferum]|uniref:Protein kinase domain-containing protein n=1 Tax=Papaver somniferum TaxID=3469 RepID=A0A4Y7J7E6_PAPSO|nr:hypothetical protein C5167_015255 [Papaver somniferum]